MSEQITTTEPNLKLAIVKTEIKKSNIVKQLLEYTSIVWPVLIIIGYIKLYFYYSYWDINIIDYLELSEIPLLFLNDIMGILTLFLIGTVLLLAGGLFNTESKKLNNVNLHNPDHEIKPADASQPLPLKAKVKKYAGPILMISVLVSVLLGSVVESLQGGGLLAVYVASYLVFAALIIPISTRLQNLPEKFNFLKMGAIIIVILLAFLFFLYLKAESDRQVAINDSHPEHLLITLKMKDTSSYKAEDYLLLGKTKSWYFLLKKNSETSKKEVIKIPVNDVKTEIAIKNNENGWIRKVLKYLIDIKS